MLMKLKVLFVAFLLTISCAKKKENVAVEEVTAKVETKSEVDTSNIKLDVYDYAGLEPLLNKKDGKVYVVNFWATWCAPCVKELPHFEKLNSEYENIEVLLVSLDFPHLYETRLKPFMVEKKLKSEVVALDDADMNTWIPKVSENWSGAIPATIIYKGDERKFYEQSFTYEELEIEVVKFLE